MITSILWAAFLFIQVWWLVWFAVLPFGVKTVESPEPMHDPGAPEQAHIGVKILATSLIAGILTALIFWGLKLGAWHWLEQLVGSF